MPSGTCRKANPALHIYRRLISRVNAWENGLTFRYHFGQKQQRLRLIMEIDPRHFVGLSCKLILTKLKPI